MRSSRYIYRIRLQYIYSCEEDGGTVYCRYLDSCFHGRAVPVSSSSATAPDSLAALGARGRG
eukprot:6179576-Pleurochrysis_carterae.AAC.3